MYFNFKVVGSNQCFNLCITNVFPVKIISMVLLMHSVLLSFEINNKHVFIIISRNILLFYC